MSNSPSSAHHSPPLYPELSQTLSLLDEAVDQLMVQTDFQAAFDTCEKGLLSLDDIETEDSRYGEFKAALCTVGIQALAEMNEWRSVLTWILQYYESPEKIPAKIMQMCILLHTKVEDQATIQDPARLWLHCQSNSEVVGFRAVAELYLLHILVPLGHWEEARELVLGDVGCGAFTEDQRQTALEIIEEKESPTCEALPESLHRNPSPDPDTREQSLSPQGAVIRKLDGMLRLLYRGLSLASAGVFPLRRVCLCLLLLYMLFVRMDPALPSSFMWISRLLQLLKQMWNAMFGPYHLAFSQN